MVEPSACQPRKGEGDDFGGLSGRPLFRCSTGNGKGNQSGFHIPCGAISFPSRLGKTTRDTGTERSAHPPIRLASGTFVSLCRSNSLSRNCGSRHAARVSSGHPYRSGSTSLDRASDRNWWVRVTRDQTFGRSRSNWISCRRSRDDVVPHHP